MLLAIDEILDFSIPHLGLNEPVAIPASAHSFVSSFWQKIGPPGKTFTSFRQSLPGGSFSKHKGDTLGSVWLELARQESGLSWCIAVSTSSSEIDRTFLYVTHLFAMTIRLEIRSTIYYFSFWVTILMRGS